MNRLQNENTRGITGWAVEIHDLVLGKYLSGREKDLEFNKQVVGLGLVSREKLLGRIGDWELPEAIKEQIRTKIESENFSFVPPHS